MIQLRLGAVYPVCSECKDSLFGSRKDKKWLNHPGLYVTGVSKACAMFFCLQWLSTVLLLKTFRRVKHTGQKRLLRPSSLPVLLVSSQKLCDNNMLKHKVCRFQKKYWEGFPLHPDWKRKCRVTTVITAVTEKWGRVHWHNYLQSVWQENTKKQYIGWVTRKNINVVFWYLVK